MSDLFDSLDASDLDEIAGKLNVSPKENTPEPIVEQVEAPAPVQEKRERKYVKFDGLSEQVNDLFEDYFYYSYGDSKGLRIDLKTRRSKSLRKDQSLRQ